MEKMRFFSKRLKFPPVIFRLSDGMEKRATHRQSTQDNQGLFATARVGMQTMKLPILDISIGGMGILVSDGFAMLQVGTEILIETMEKQGQVIATSIPGRVAHLGPGVPSRVGIEFSPADTPIEAYTQLHKHNGKSRTITDRDEIEQVFAEVKKYSRGYGDMVMISKQKAIPAEFFYLRPKDDNMVLRVVRISEFRLPFQPEVDKTYPFYLFKGVNVMYFTAKVTDVVKNIIETTWPTKIQYISRRSVLRYFVTGQEPLTGKITHPITGQEVGLFVWDISAEGMGVELLNDETPLIESMHLENIRIDLPDGPIQVQGMVRSVRTENVLQKTQLGVEFTGGEEGYQERILGHILSMDMPSEGLLGGFNQKP